MVLMVNFASALSRAEASMAPETQSVYYKRIGRIPENWKYKSVIAQLE